MSLTGKVELRQRMTYFEPGRVLAGWREHSH